MLHRAMFGSLERFTGILIEHYAGHLPLWLAPTQVVVATITSDADDYAREVAELARRAGLRVEADLRNEKINYKVREHSLAKVPAAARRRQEGGGDPHGLDPPARRAGAEGDGARRGAGGARRRGGAAGREAGAFDVGNMTSGQAEPPNIPRVTRLSEAHCHVHRYSWVHEGCSND